MCAQELTTLEERVDRAGFTEIMSLTYLGWEGSGENFISDRDEFVSNSFINFKPVKRFENRRDV